MMEIFNRYGIYLEDDDSLDFEDLLEKAMVIIRYRKFLADFIQDKETDMANKYTDSQGKVSLPPIWSSLYRIRLRPPNFIPCKGVYKKTYLLSKLMPREFMKLRLVKWTRAPMTAF